MRHPLDEPDHTIDWSKVFRACKKPFVVSGVAVFLIWVLSWALVYVAFSSQADRGQFGDMFGAVNSLFSGLAFAGVGIALLLHLTEISKAHEWNRRRSAHELTFEVSLGKFGDIRRLFEADDRINIWDKNQTVATRTNADGTPKKLTRTEQLQLDAILNFHENVCLAIKNGVVDEEIVYRALSDIVIAYYRWAGPYIKDCRANEGSEFWIETDPYELRWRGRAEIEAAAQRTANEEARLARLKTGRSGL